MPPLRNAIVLLLLSAVACAQSDDTDDHPGTQISYSLSTPDQVAGLGDSITVNWQGSQSHPNDYQNWDWVAMYQRGACNASGIVGEDTCYGTNQWGWVSSNGGSESGSWTFTPDGPGEWEFRISYCGCDECNDVSGNFAACDGYLEVGVSGAVTVKAPFDISSFSSEVQFGLGMLWVEFEGVMSSMNSLLQRSSPKPSCNSCLCSLMSVIKDMDSAVGDFRTLWEGFSMSQLESTIGDLSTVVSDFKSAFVDCDVDAIAGKDLTAELMEAAAGLVDGLDQVEAVVKMAISGENIYSAASNAYLGWEQGNFFASGVNTAKLINLLLSTTDLKDPAIRERVVALAISANEASMARRPGGMWVPCSSVPTPHTAVCIDVIRPSLRS